MNTALELTKLILTENDEVNKENAEPRWEPNPFAIGFVPVNF